MAVDSIGNQKTIQQIMDQTSTTSSAPRNTGSLGKDDFLNLMVTQLQYQDPLNPTDDKEFIGQMAQFSSLEQMQNLNTSFTSVKAFNMIGKYVTATNTDASGNSSTVSGTVSSVKVSSGKATVVVNGQDISVDNITDVADGIGTGVNISAYSNLIGYNADGAMYDSNTGNMVAVNGTIKAIQKGVYEDYAVMDGVQVQISNATANPTTTDPNYLNNYLSSNEGKTVNVDIVNSTSGKKVSVSGTLQAGWKTVNGKITATLNDVNVPVESVSDIKPLAKQPTNEENLLQQILDKLTTPAATTQQNSTSSGNSAAASGISSIGSDNTGTSGT